MGCGASKPPARPASDPPAPQPPAAAPAPEPAPSASKSTSPAANPPPAPVANSWDDWDEDEDDGSAPNRSSQLPPTAVAPGATPPQPTEHAAFRDAGGVLCIGAIAAAAMEVGLRCTSCGQRVHRFEAYQWHASADYYTFRNYAPDERMPLKLQEDLGKLARWLRPADSASGGAAYACGCSWQSLVGREAKPIEGEAGEGVLAAPHGGARLGEAEPRLKWVVAT